MSPTPNWKKRRLNARRIVQQQEPRPNLTPTNDVNNFRRERDSRIIALYTDIFVLPSTRDTQHMTNSMRPLPCVGPNITSHRSTQKKATEPSLTKNDNTFGYWRWGCCNTAGENARNDLTCMQKQTDPFPGDAWCFLVDPILPECERCQAAKPEYANASLHPSNARAKFSRGTQRTCMYLCMWESQPRNQSAVCCSQKNIRDEGCAHHLRWFCFCQSKSADGSSWPFL